MKVLVTGAKGFIGKNLITELNRLEDTIVYEFDVDTDVALLDEYCKSCDFVFNLAGVNRPETIEEFMEGNFGFATTLVDTLKKYGNTCPIMNSSSIQAKLDNPYGKSKKAGEDMLFTYGKETGAKIYIYRLPNVFGKWCRPNYNSAVATFCNNIANGLPIQVNDRSTQMQLVYIDDVVEELLAALKGEPHVDASGYCYVPCVHEITLGEIVDLLYSYKESRTNYFVPNMPDNSFAKKLYSTYLSYLPTDGFSYPVKMNVDNRGSFTEILKSVSNGQVSINISKPGITKGNHWHHTKNEKFIVVSGKGLIQFRKIGTDEIFDYYVSGDKWEVVDIPTGYTHNIINVGETDMVTLMWCNECFNPDKPDTIYEAVVQEEK